MNSGMFEIKAEMWGRWRENLEDPKTQTQQYLILFRFSSAQKAWHHIILHKSLWTKLLFLLKATQYIAWVELRFSTLSTSSVKIYISSICMVFFRPVFKSVEFIPTYQSRSNLSLEHLSASRAMPAFCWGFYFYQSDMFSRFPSNSRLLYCPSSSLLPNAEKNRTEKNIIWRAFGHMCQAAA